MATGLVYEYTSRRKAADALRNLESAFPPEFLEQVAVFVSVDGVVLIRANLAPPVSQTDIAKAEGIFSGGQRSSRDLSSLVSSLEAYREIYLGEGWRMFRAYGWRKT